MVEDLVMLTSYFDKVVARWNIISNMDTSILGLLMMRVWSEYHK